MCVCTKSILLGSHIFTYLSICTKLPYIYGNWHKSVICFGHSSRIALVYFKIIIVAIDMSICFPIVVNQLVSKLAHQEAGRKCDERMILVYDFQVNSYLMYFIWYMCDHYWVWYTEIKCNRFLNLDNTTL